MNKIEELALAMIEYNDGDPKRIQHTTKVHAYASLIGRCGGAGRGNAVCSWERCPCSWHWHKGKRTKIRASERQTTGAGRPCRRTWPANTTGRLYRPADWTYLLACCPSSYLSCVRWLGLSDSHRGRLSGQSVWGRRIPESHTCRQKEHIQNWKRNKNAWNHVWYILVDE